jgi:iron complex outermembrane recepter protein
MGVAIPCPNNTKRRLKQAANSVAALIVLPVSGMAQDVPASADATKDLEEVVVTGTNIRSAGFSALVPLQVVGAAQLENIGTAQFNDVLKTIPGNAGSEMFTEASPRAGNSQFNLRGLGYTSTLTLLNGRRAGVSPLSDETGAEFVDINQFPLAMVERIEVLKDGASAIYGSDAVAGVVNIITRRGFDGAEVSAGYQDATNEAANANFALGHTLDRGFVSVYGTYYHQTGNDRTDFDWLVKRIHGNGVLGRSQLLNANAAPSNYRLAGRNAAGQPIGLGGGVAFADPDCEAAGGVFRIRDNGTVDGSQCLHDFADQVAIIPEASRAQVFTEFDYELTDSVSLFGEASYSRNVLRSTKGPGSYSNGAAVSNSSGNIFIPASHPFNFFVRNPADANRLLYIGPDNWNPAIHSAVDLVAASRVFGVQYNAEGADERRSETEYIRTVMGLDARFGSTLSGQLSYQFAGADFEDLQPFRYNAAALNAALLDGSLNPFGTSVARPDLVSPKDGISTARNEQAVVDQVLVTSRDTARSEQHVVDAVLSGSLFDLSAGSVGFAVGGQYRAVSLKETPDALQASGLGDAPTAAITIDREQDVFAVYSELSAPLGSRANAQLALRYEDYGGNVGSSVDPKFALRVTPTEWLTLRGSIGTSFQAPTIRQTSESVTRIFINDPTTLDNGVLTCRDTGRTSNPLVRTSGDESLEPQTATNYNFGIILSPLRALDFGVDYWHYKYEDLIAASANAQAIVTRDCADGVPNDPRITREGAGLLNEIATEFINVGQVETDGLDLSLAYQFDAGIGGFQFTADATYLRKFDVLGGEGGVFDGAGNRNFANNFRSMPKWRATTGLLWDYRAISSNLAVRYIDSYVNDQSNNAPISSFTAVDLSVAYRLTWGGHEGKPMLLSVGADNLFDRDPPSLVRYNAAGQRIQGTVNDVDRPSYDAYSGVDIRGRILWARAKYEF